MSLAAVCAACAGGLMVLGSADLLAGAWHGRDRERAPRRFSMRGVARAVGKVGIGTITPPADLRARVLAAGDPGGLGMREWVSLKCIAAAGAAACGVFVAPAAPGRIGILLVAAAPAAGFLWPDLWLARRSRARAEAACSELPGMLDLLRVSIDAGQTPIAAIGAVGARFSGPLAAEWRAAAAQVALGVSQDHALEQMKERIAADAVRSFVESLRSARRRGLPLVDVLEAQAAAARHARRQQIRERAARAGPKIQLVVALVLVPSVLLTMAAVLSAELSETGFGLGF